MPADRALAEALKAHGIDAAPAVWSNTAVPWQGFQAALIRSPWDYYLRAAEFEAWLDRIEALRLSLWNPVRTVRWNMHKGYLSELAEAGAPLPGTVVVRGDALAPSLSAIFTERGWPALVMKPAVSGGAFETYKVERDDAAAFEERYRGIHMRGDVIVQEYCPRIETSGELSLIYVGGVFTHACRKVPKDADFRVQERFGGRNLRHTPTALEHHAAERVLEATKKLGYEHAYARVDLVHHANDLVLMELEVIEPWLFLDTVPEATEQVAELLARRLVNSQT
ncbi:MAG: RimK family alpha-L-glutamate ligase [Myxococcota bacterium]